MFQFLDFRFKIKYFNANEFRMQVKIICDACDILLDPMTDLFEKLTVLIKYLDNGRSQRLSLLL